MKKSIIVISALNLLGIFCLVLYVLGARHQAVMEGRDFYDFGDGLGFMLFVIPIAFLCIVGNIAWVVMAALDIYRGRNYRSMVAFVAVVVLWGVSVQVGRMVAELPSSQVLSSER
jgi:hypothetical protein